jgi:hypothetical protein
MAEHAEPLPVDCAGFMARSERYLVRQLINRKSREEGDPWAKLAWKQDSTEARAVATVPDHPDAQVDCQIRDISKSGMCIVVEDQIVPGKIVKVTWSDHFLVGRVQRESTVGAEFLVGLELLYCSKWNEPAASAAKSA